MSVRRFKKEAGYVDHTKLARGPNGRACCRRCGVEVPEGRLTFCGEACIHEWKLRTNSNYLRAIVQKRDRGVCALCGLDTIALGNRRFGDPSINDELTASGWSTHKSLWEADHIVPVIEGGGECGIENYRTLCQICHKRVTAELAARRAAARRKTKATTQSNNL